MSAVTIDIPELEIALRVVASVMIAGRKSHPLNDGFRQPARFHLLRAMRHLALDREGDREQDHLAHAAARLLMALQVR